MGALSRDHFVEDRPALAVVGAVNECSYREFGSANPNQAQSYDRQYKYQRDTVWTGISDFNFILVQNHMPSGVNLRLPWPLAKRPVPNFLRYITRRALANRHRHPNNTVSNRTIIAILD
jgi:hypothetical protein